MENLIFINISDRAELVVGTVLKANYAIHAKKGTSLPFGRHRAEKSLDSSLLFYKYNV